MHIVNSRLDANRPRLTVFQMMFMVLKGFGHLATMAGTVYVIASFMYMAVNAANLIDVATGVLIIVAGYLLQQLGDKLEERHMLNAQHLDIDIRQITTRLLTVTTIVAAILFV